MTGERLPPPDDTNTRAAILEATLARLDAERLAPPSTPHPTVREAAERRRKGLDEHGYPRPEDLPPPVRHLRRVV